MKHLYLTDIKKGIYANIQHIKSDATAKSELSSIGIFPGVTIQVEKNERESLMVKTGCCHIAINKSLAHKIIIEE
ncbi:MAG: FeoA family protein [Candidatus Methanofastidiosia archaeon]